MFMIISYSLSVLSVCSEFLLRKPLSHIVHLCFTFISYHNQLWVWFNGEILLVEVFNPLCSILNIMKRLFVIRNNSALCWISPSATLWNCLPSYGQYGNVRSDTDTEHLTLLAYGREWPATHFHYTLRWQNPENARAHRPVDHVRVCHMECF